MVAKLDIKLAQHFANDPKAFRDDARIKVGTEFQRFGLVAEPWQLQDFAAMDPAWHRLSIGSGEVSQRFAYLERPRGHSKTTDIALSVTHPILFSQRALFGIVASGDIDQAAILKRAMDVLLQGNPWMASGFEVQRNCIVNPKTGSRLEILSSNVETSWGHTPDFILADELTVWPSSGERLFHSLFSAAEKQSHCVFTIISNAGFGKGESWQWRIREDARTQPDWYFHSLPGPVASWFTPAALERQRRVLPDPVYRRVWLNEWTSGYGDALTEDEITAAILTGQPHHPPPGPMSGNEPGWSFIGAIDIGISHDATCFLILGKRGTECRLANVWDWRAPKGGKVSLDEVERTVIAAQRQYRMVRVATDPWNAAQLIERCRKQRVPIVERPQQGKMLVDQCMALLDAFRSGAIKLYPFESLISDLRTARVEERQYGYRLVSDHDESGHGDRLTSLSICLAAARDVTATGGVWGGVIMPHDISADRLAGSREQPVHNGPRYGGIISTL
jgi:hypothetical protein